MRLVKLDTDRRVREYSTKSPETDDAVVRLVAEAELGDADGGDRPGLATVSGGHLTRHAATLGHRVDIVGVRHVEDDLGVDPG